MAAFNVEKYVPTINSILRVSDLATISAKRIRNALAQEFPNDEIKQNKSILDQRILDCFGVIRAEREGSEDDEPLNKKPRRPSHDLLKSDLVHPSSPVSASPKRKPNAPPDPRPPKKPKPAAVAYTSDDDAKFAAELDQVLNSTPVRKTRGGGGVSRSKPKSRGKSEGGGEKKEKRKRAANPNNAFNAPQLLSPQLAAVVGETELSRPAVVKKLWGYIKENDLQNPLQKAEIICDDKLRPIFNVDKIHMFTMNKILSKHIFAKEDVVGGNSSANTPAKKSVTAAPSNPQPSPPKRNGKPVLSDTRVKSEESEEEDEPPSPEDNKSDESDVSRFSDSEDD